MKILVVSRSFFPQLSPRSFRTTELASELVRQGHQVTLAIPAESPESETYCQNNGIDLFDLGRPRWPEIEIRGSRVIRFARRVLRRLMAQAFEYPQTEISYQIKRKLKALEGFDLAITIAAPHAVHWGFASLIAKNENICKTWIADCGDPFMGVTLDSFPPTFYFTYFEKQFCRRADFITVPIKEAIPAYYPEFHHKIRVIPQGFRFPEPEFWPHYKPNPIPTFAFAGTFISKIRDPRPVLEFLTTLDQQFKFVCYTKQREMIADYENKLQSQLEIRDFAPREQLLKELHTMDFLLNLENGTQLQSPSKLIDYALTERPILSLDVTQLDTTKIVEFLSGDYSRQLKRPEIDAYNISRVAGQFIELATDKSQVVSDFQNNN